MESNLLAQRFCSADPEGMRDLQQQYNRFMTEPYEGRGKGRERPTSVQAVVPAEIQNDLAVFVRVGGTA